MKRATLLAMTTVFCLGLTASAFTQCGRTLVFQVDSGGRIPASGTASGNAEQNRTVNTPANHPHLWKKFTFTVQGFQPGERVLDVTLNLDIVHSWVEDLNIWLRSPSGTWVQLFNRLPGGPPRFDNFDNTYFTGRTATRIQDGRAPYEGNYRPMQTLGAFRRETPNGTWELWIYDHYFGDYGNLYRRGDGRFEENEPGAPRWREPHNQPGRRSEGGNPFEGGTWLEITAHDVSGGGGAGGGAGGPFVYFAGNPANSWYTVGGTCESLTLTANYLFFISGDVSSAGLPARWTALPFEICAPMTFDSIVYMPGLTSGFPNLRIWITGAQTGGDGRTEPNLNDIKFAGDFGLYPGDPPQTGDVQIHTYYGGTTTFTYLRTTPLGQSVTLQPGLYFAIIVADEDFASAGPFDSYVALAMGAPGGPKLYYNPRGQGSQNLGGILAPSVWQRFRYNTSVAPYTCERILNTDMQWRDADPFADTPPWNSVPNWNRYHGPALYHGVLGFRNSTAPAGRVIGTVVVPEMGSPLAPTSVEVIYYRPGTKQRVARFSMPTTTGYCFNIDTPWVEAGWYDIVVRAIYNPSIITTNCPISICITSVTDMPHPLNLGIRLSNINVAGSVNLGLLTLLSLDVNGDALVDDADLLYILFNFGTDEPFADVNNDGVVDDADLLIVLFNFGTQGEDGDEECN